MTRLVVAEPGASTTVILSVRDDCTDDAEQLVVTDIERENLMSSTALRVASAVEDPLWRMELAKFAVASSNISVIDGFALADAFLRSDRPAATYALRSEEPRAVLQAAAYALCHAGHTVEAPSHSLLTSRLATASAFLAAGLVWLFVAFRHGGDATAALLEGHDDAYALYGEASGRTVHLRKLLTTEAESAPVLIVGRPTGSLERAADALGLAADRCLRAFDRRSALRTFVPTIRYLLDHVVTVSRSPVRLPWREAVAIGFRMMQGRAQQAWWGSLEDKPKRIVFGHTGLADTSALELEMQKTHTMTVHAVHGLSHGWNFAGLSDAALFTCGHDATLAEPFGAYGRTDFAPLAPPPPRPEGKDWAVLTGYAHPSNPAYHRDGVTPDIQALEIVVEAFDRSKRTDEILLWKPHPALAKLPRHDQDDLTAAATRLTGGRWPDDRPLDALSDLRVVVTTPSTVLVDGLRLGKLPLLVTTAPLPPDHLYSSYPFVATDAAELVAMVEELQRPRAFEKAFAHAWGVVRPGTPVDLAALDYICGLQSRPET